MIDSLFHFINQLSQNFSPNKKIFDVNNYINKKNDLTNDLNNLNQHILNACNPNNKDNLYNKKNTLDENKKSNYMKKESKLENILGEKFSFGQDDNRENSYTTKKNNDTLNNSNSNRNKNYNDNNQNLGFSIKKNDNENGKNIINNNKFNCIPKENDVIQSLNNIIYK